jgi:pantothenate synthetase
MKYNKKVHRSISICEERSIDMIFFTPVYELIMKGFEGLETVIKRSIWSRVVKGDETEIEGISVAITYIHTS